MAQTFRPYAKLTPVPNASVRWTGGFWVIPALEKDS